MVKVSVIIPVYNVEEYLTECLDSIVNQSLKELEIICIDDCSTDGSYNILLDYAKKDNRFKVLKTDINSGQAAARNLGIKKAIGEYISFIDPDDYVNLNYMENLYNTAKKYNSDIVNTLNIVVKSNNNYYFSYPNSKQILEAIKNKKDYESNISIRNINDFSSSMITYHSWNKLYKNNFLKNNILYFHEEGKPYSEDADFNNRLLLHNPKASFNNSSIYYYRYRESSTTKSHSNNILKCISYLNNSINYYKNNKKELLLELYPKICANLIECFLHSTDENKIISYNEVNKFMNNLFIDESIIDKKLEYYNIMYNNYVLIRCNATYYDYITNKSILDRIELLEKKLNYNNNWIRLFGININKDYIILVILGIKFSIKIKK